MARDQEYDNTNTGALFENRRRTSNKAPQWRGQITVKTPDGEILEYWVSCWEKESRSGDQFFSLALDLKEDNDGRDGDDRRRGGRNDRDDRRPSRRDDRDSRDSERRSTRSSRDRDDRGDPRDRDRERRYEDDDKPSSQNKRDRDLDDEVPF